MTHSLSSVSKALCEEAKVTLPQEILGAMEHRGFYDCGKYLDDDVIEPVIKALLSSHRHSRRHRLPRK